jgi:predicted secreted protein
MAKTYEPIATTTLGSDQASVSFSSFSGYTDLRIVSVVRSSIAGQSDTLALRLNSDSGGNYSWTLLRGDGSTASSLRSSNTTYLGIAEVIGASQTAGVFNVVTTDLMNYANTTTNKTAISRSSVALNYGAEAWVTMWRNTAAVTSLSLSMVNGSNLLSGSTFTLYGIKAA